MESIRNIQRKLDAYCQILDVPRDRYPLAEKKHAIQDGVYFSNKPTYSFCVAERGTIIRRVWCDTATDMYYGILKILSFEIAVHIEAKQRKAGEDPRRQIFSIQYELLQKVDDEFARMLLADVEEILRTHPYNDDRFSVTNDLEPDSKM